MKPVIFVSPLTLSLKKLREILSQTSTNEGIEVYEIESIDEANQTIASIGPSVILISNAEKCLQILKKNKKQISNFKSKTILLSQGSITPLDLEKLRKLGLTEQIVEPINQKNLIYKVKMLLKALPTLKTEEESEDEKTKTFSSNKEEKNLKTNEKLHLEKGISSDAGLDLDSDNIEDEKTLFSLEKEKKEKKKNFTLNLDDNEDDSSKKKELTLDGEVEVKNKSSSLTLDVDDESPKNKQSAEEVQGKTKKSRLGNLLKSIGSLGKKKKTEDLDVTKEEPENKSPPLEFDIDEELRKKKLEILLSREEKKPSDEITIDDIKRMRKQGIILDISPNTPQDRLDEILKRDPVSRKKIINFKLAEEAKKNKKAGIVVETENKAKKKESSLDLMKVKSGQKMGKDSTKEKIIEERRRLLEQKLKEDAELKELEAQEEAKRKEEEAKIIIYEPDSKSVEKIIEMLVIYQDKKMDRFEVFKRCSQAVFEFKNGLVSFLSYNQDKKEFEDLYISHIQEFNTDKQNRGEEHWQQLRSERIKIWAETKTAKWSDEWFSGSARDAEFISPVIEGKNILGIVVANFAFKEDQHLSEIDARRVEVFIESTRGVFLERFKGSSKEKKDDDADLGGDGKSYSMLFKEFFNKILNKAA